MLIRHRSRVHPMVLNGSVTGYKRQHVTLLFSDLCAFTQLAENVDPEVVVEVVHRIKAAADTVLRRHSGLLNQDYGDGVMAVFGFPTPQEDDVRRATEAALELHEVIPALALASLLPPGFEVAMHSGIHSGVVVVGDGDPIQGRYELTGDAVNVASRLSNLAERNEIYVSEETILGLAEYFVTRPLGLLPLRGRNRSVYAHSVIGRSAVKTRFEARVKRGLTEFVGRERELRELDTELRSAFDGRARVVGVIGDAGIGKTRLIEEFLRRIQPLGCRVHRGYCESYGEVAPLQLYTQICRRLEEDESLGAPMRARVDELSQALLRVRSLAAHSQALAEDLARATAEVLIATGAGGLSVLFVDDWQWADDLSRQTASFLAEMVRGRPVLILVACRKVLPTDPTLSGAKLVRLEPFSSVETRDAIRSLLPGWFDLGFTEQIYEQSGGNPLFVEELCLSITAWKSGDSPAPTNHHDAVPDWLYGLINTRVEGLPDELTELVHIAAVIGSVVPRWLLEQVGGQSLGEPLFSALVGNDLIYAGETEETLRFKHGITREVVYQSVGLHERRRLHRRIAEVLEGSEQKSGLDEIYEILAYHYAGAADPVKTAHYAELAGDKAMAASSLDRANQQYRSALVALDALMTLEQQPGRSEVYDKWTSVIMRWALAIVYSPSRDQLEILRRAIERGTESGNADGVAWAEYWSGFVLYSLGDLAQSIEHFTRAERIALTAGNAKLATQVEAALGHSHAAATEYESALQRLDQAIAVKRKYRSSSGLPVTLAYSTMCKATVLADRGNFTLAHELAFQAIEAVSGSGHEVEGSILALHAATLLWQGRWKQALDTSRKAQTVALRVHGPYVFAMGRSLEGYAWWMLERSPDALERLREATHWLEDWDIRLYVSFNYGWLAELSSLAGLGADARKYAGRALWRARRQDRYGGSLAYRALARVAVRETGRLDAGEGYLQRALSAADARGARHERAVTLMHLAELRADAGLLAQAQTMFVEMGMVGYQEQANQLAERL